MKLKQLRDAHFEINVGGKHDLLMLRGMAGETAGWVESNRLASDFEITWARFANEQARLPDELLAIGGQMLEVDGRTILNSEDRIESFTAKRFGDEFV